MKKLLAILLVAMMVPVTAGMTSTEAAAIPKYKRSQWKHWLDVDGDCQNIRAELLIDKSKREVGFRSNRKCTVDSGFWLGPYTNKVFTKASDLHIDHVVPLKNAHVSGGWRWTAKEKKGFANDPLNLQVVSARANMSKSAKTPDQWRPPYKGAWCGFANRWRFIKDKYDLEYTRKEKEAVKRMLNECD